ncbi:MAG: DUF167 domain-containing protein [Candidatus Nanoarchaeia archaeon]
MRVLVKVIPNSKKNEVIQKNSNELIVKVKSPPEKGKANKELIKLLSNYFNKNVALVSGETSKYKIIEILT